MRYNKIRKMDISNGTGVRVSIFVQGCEFHCVGCFNPETWNFNGGKEFTDETLSTILTLCEKPEISGLSILGGEPLHEKNIDTVISIARAFKNHFPNKDLWIWTGYTFEYLKDNLNDESLFLYVDYLVDGQFVEKEKNLKLKWSGSNNQRVINIKETLKQNKIIIKE